MESKRENMKADCARLSYQRKQDHQSSRTELYDDVVDDVDVVDVTSLSALTVAANIVKISIEIL